MILSAVAIFDYLSHYTVGFLSYMNSFKIVRLDYNYVVLQFLK